MCEGQSATSKRPHRPAAGPDEPCPWGGESPAVSACRLPTLDCGLRLLATAMEHTTEGILITSADGTIEYVNPALEQISGHSKNELIGRTPAILKSGRHDASFYRMLWETLGRGQTWHGLFTNKRKDGSFYEEEASISPLCDPSGGVTHYVAVKRDITERLELETQLHHARKLEAIGQLAAGIAHEINTPTQYIGDNARFLQEAFGQLLQLMRPGPKEDGPAEATGDSARRAEATDLDFLVAEIPRAIHETLEGIGRVSNIVRAMREFSHPSEEAAPVDINRAIESTITVARNEWKYVAEMKTDLDPTLPPVPCVAGDVNQVILNLIVNAAHAVAEVAGDGFRGKGAITVRTRQDGDCVEVRVTDTGCGIPREIQDRIFDPFFTTKEVGKGTGQGLSIAHTVVVQKHGGTIRVDSEVGRGTCFSVRLPLAGKAATPIGAP